VSSAGPDMVEVFLQEASEHLQFLREYSSILQDAYPAVEDLERLYVAAHTLVGASGLYGFPRMSEIAGKLSHIFQYVMNAGISQEAAGPLVEFIYEAVATLESDLLMISANGIEADEEIAAFKVKYPFAFPAEAEKPRHSSSPSASSGQALAPKEGEEDGAGADAAAHEPTGLGSPVPQAEEHRNEAVTAVPASPVIPDLEPDGEVPQEVLEFFVPEVEEHMQVVTECLLALEASPNPDEIHRLFRAMHTIKGSAAQVGLHRISRVAHRAEDLIGRLRDGELQPSASMIDLCLESVDALKKFLYSQWPDEATMQASVKSLLGRIAKLAPEEGEAVATQLQEGVAYVPPISEEALEEVTPSSPTLSPTAGEEGGAPDTAVVQKHAEVVPPAIVAQATPEDHDEAEAAVAKKAPTAAPQSKSVRIALERLDRMMNAVGELVINRTRMLGRVAELERLADVLNFSKARMSDKISEFQEKYEFNQMPRQGASRAPVPFTPAFGSPLVSSDTAFGGSDPFPFRGGYSSYSHSHDSSLAEFSELEMDRYDEFNILSRSLTEISADITEVLSQLDGFVRRVDGDIDEFTKLAHRLQDEITQARMVPIGNLYTRIQRTARDAAKAANKLIELQLEGAETELDNNIIQQIADPLLHLVRNSVAHGIEKAEDRYSAGKPDHGNVIVRAYHRGNHIYIEVEDDGRGLDYEKIRATGIDLGLISAEQAAQMAERELLELIFHPGFSTAPRKTELAGRGVGLDVVRANVTALNGEIDIDTQKGLGTRFTLKVPLTLIISQALFVRCGQSQFAFPLSFVEEIRRISDPEIEEVGGKLLTKVRDVVTEVVKLDRELGLPPIEPMNGFYRMVLVNIGGRQVGVVVEEVLRKDEIVIKNLGEYLRNVKLFPGVTIAPDGSLILLVDLNRLVAGEAMEKRPLMLSNAISRVFAPGAAAVAAGHIPAGAIAEVAPEKVIVLADDSISVRKFVGRMLEKAGYRVKLACDGLEALEIISQGGVDLVISDLEMPRTNGYELLMHMRQDAAMRKVPVMVVTSRAGEKHRERAIAEGARGFLVKPVQEDQLIASVAEMIGSARPQAPLSIAASVSA
jgi:chemosensory pili system protein ChpA (sensor histidine kinase/response regulator)